MTQLTDTGFHFGDPAAPIKLTVFTNLACPHCAAFFTNNDLTPYFENKQLELVLKFFDKPKIGLLKGNLVHLFLDYNDQAKTNPIILELFKDQPEWKKLSDDELKNYLKEKYGFEAHPENTDYSLTIAKEAIDFNATSVPTALISINGEAPKEINQDELKKTLESVPAN